MVLDLNKFTPGAPLVPDTMWVGEQIPGHYVATDVTNQVKTLHSGFFKCERIDELQGRHSEETGVRICTCARVESFSLSRCLSPSNASVDPLALRKLCDCALLCAT